MHGWARVFSVILIAVGALAVASSSGAAERDPDWVFDIEWYYMDHFCVHTWSYYPVDVTVPWEEVAWGTFDFELERDGGFFSEGGIPCTLSYGGQAHEVEAWPVGDCGDYPDCYDHHLSVGGSYTVVNPTDEYDFEFFVTSDHCDSACGSFDCQPYGRLTGTLSLYAEPTATALASWSTIKARY